MSLIRITNPSCHAVSKAEFYEHIRMRGSTAEDYLIESYLGAAESYAENYMKRSIMPQQWRLTRDYISEVIELPRGPLSTLSSAVSNFSYYDSTNGTNAMPTTCYTIDTNAYKPRIYRTYDADWPDDIRDYKDSINIEYWTGYKNKDSVPDAIKTWIKMRAAAIYENRESIVIGSANWLTELPRSHVDCLLDEFSIIEII